MFARVPSSPDRLATLAQQLDVLAPDGGSVADAVAACLDRQRALEFQRRCPRPELGHLDYMAQAFEARDGRVVVVELRFRGLDVTRPFVELRASNVGLAPHHVSDLLPAIGARFAAVSPRRLRVYLTARQEADPRWDELPSAPELRIFAAPLARLRARPLPDQFDALELRDKDSSNKEAALFAWEALVGGELAGAIALECRPFGGEPGFAIVEQELAPEFRGRRLGAVMQRHAIERLEADGICFGAIEPDNIASIKTARRIGRADVGGFRSFDMR